MHIEKPSLTALGISRVLVRMAQHPEFGSLVSPLSIPYHLAFIQACIEAQFFWLRWFQLLCSEKSILAKVFERMTVPGISLYFVLRKKWIEEQLLELINNGGIEQVLILGAGFDPLALIYAPHYPEVQWVEIDFPSTARVKQNVCLNQGWQSPNLHFVAADLIQSLNQAQVSHLLPGAINPTRPTLILAEGLLMYLPEAINRLLLLWVHTTFSAPQTRLMFTALERSQRGQIICVQGFPWIEWFLSWRREPLLWSIQEDQMESWLQSQGFELCSMTQAGQMAKSFLTENQQASTMVAKGEWTVLARTQIHTRAVSQ